MLSQSTPLRRTSFFSDARSCTNTQLVLEITDDTTKTGGTCSASGSCSLTVANETDNTVMRRSNCLPGPMVDSSLSMRTNIYSDATCSSAGFRSSYGYFNGCFVGSLNGLTRAASSRYACDASGNTFTITYAGASCSGAALSCSKLNSGPAGNACVPYVYGFNLWQRATCDRVSTDLPALCYPSGGLPAPGVATTRPATTRPAANFDLNRDGVVNTLDVVYMMDNFGRCPTTGECRADVAVPYGVVDNFDLVTLYNALPSN